ncbi:hypothetical protein [Roseivirga sp. UBA1976]|uniref:hypothetical protein n=1 Tax=Roseivirga sp. UBA1976 TaxID=1947386 RepID=UPI00257ECC4D|nr:hypothetical protein [Roseivirga sp. UBA1976]MEC7754531.1 hypothetical protein [Bacteroidota bacterium]
MSKYDDHIAQATNNLEFLVEVNAMGNNRMDWQVTIAFYTSLHLINVHVLATTGKFYQKHIDVHFAINPHKHGDGQLPIEIYRSYMKLFRLSRRSRYLCSDDPKATPTMNNISHHIKPSHLAKAFRNLDKVLDFFVTKHNLKIDPSEVECDALGNSESMKFFKKKA